MRKFSFYLNSNWNKEIEVLCLFVSICHRNAHTEACTCLCGGGGGEILFFAGLSLLFAYTLRSLLLSYMFVCAVECSQLSQLLTQCR